MTQRNDDISLDVCMVATRRPDLITQTLASFQDKVFSSFDIRSFRINLDPIFGTQQDQDDCIEIVNGYFPQAKITVPEAPGFCAAVKRLWAGAEGRLMLHLEDDWIVHEPITHEQINALIAEGYSAIAPLSKHHPTTPGVDYICKVKTRRILGIPVSRRIIPKLGTSPKFILSDYAIAVAGQLNPDLDPEKQMTNNLNPALEKFIAERKCHLLRDAKGGPLITDIGRAWRDARMIEKVVVDGRSIWHSADAS